jgi:hypothetical protein
MATRLSRCIAESMHRKSKTAQRRSVKLLSSLLNRGPVAAPRWPLRYVNFGPRPEWISRSSLIHATRH